MEFIDSHAHLNADQFKDSWLEIANRAQQSGVVAIINNASDLANTEWGIEQAEKHSGIFATAGIHPEVFLESDQPIDQNHFDNLRRLINSTDKVVAVGEIGLDYTIDSSRASKQKQWQLLEPQLQLAVDRHLPVTLHVRDKPGHTECFADIVSMLKQFTTSSGIRGVFHCWVGTPDQARIALDLGFYLSFSGILTYKSAGHITEVAAIAPQERILIETDAPFLTPEPARSKLRQSTNLPEYVIMTAEKLAVIRGVDLDHIARTTTQNTCQLFKLNVEKHKS